MKKYENIWKDMKRYEKIWKKRKYENMKKYGKYKKIWKSNNRVRPSDVHISGSRDPEFCSSQKLQIKAVSVCIFYVPFNQCFGSG